MLCFVVVMQSFIMNSHEVFIHIHQGCFAGTGAIVRLPQCQWSKPDGYGKISQCITTTKHSKAKTVCIFLGIYRNSNSTDMLWSMISISVISLNEIHSVKVYRYQKLNPIMFSSVMLWQPGGNVWYWYCLAYKQTETAPWIGISSRRKTVFALVIKNLCCSNHRAWG